MADVIVVEVDRTLQTIEMTPPDSVEIILVTGTPGPKGDPGDANGVTQEELDAYGTELSEPGAVVRRANDPSAWFEVHNIDLINQPTQDRHATRKDYVDGIGTPSPYPDTIARRDVNGWLNVSGLILDQTTGPDTAARRDYVDSAVAGRIPAFADPNADRLVFWDDSAGVWAALAVGTGLVITGTTISASAQSPTIANLPAGSTLTIQKDPTTGFWPTSYAADGTPSYTGGANNTGVRPTARNDVYCQWKGPDPSPAVVSTGTGGLRNGIDTRFITP